MGMDVYGRNPKQNKPIEEFPVYHKYTMMEKSDKDDNIDGFKQKWKELDADRTLREQYYSELEKYEDELSSKDKINHNKLIELEARLEKTTTIIYSLLNKKADKRGRKAKK